MVIAVDFDGTLCEHKFPEIGEIKKVHKNVANYIREAKKQGNTIILWTCREDLPERPYLTEAVMWCKVKNIPIDYVNEYPNSPFTAPLARKICANIYIDDKALNVGNFIYRGEWDENNKWNYRKTYVIILKYKDEYTINVAKKYYTTSMER